MRRNPPLRGGPSQAALGERSQNEGPGGLQLDFCEVSGSGSKKGGEEDSNEGTFEE